MPSCRSRPDFAKICFQNRPQTGAWRCSDKRRIATKWYMYIQWLKELWVMATISIYRRCLALALIQGKNHSHPVWKKSTFAVRETFVSRHNRGKLRAPNYAPHYWTMGMGVGGSYLNYGYADPLPSEVAILT